MLEQLKLMLGLSDIDETMQSKLEQILDITSQRLCVMLNASTVPAELQYIVIEVAIKRYNRIGSEGVSSHNVQGEQMQWNSADDFDEYKDEMQAWLDAQEDPTTMKGRIRFI